MNRLARFAPIALLLLVAFAVIANATHNGRGRVAQPTMNDQFGPGERLAAIIVADHDLDYFRHGQYVHALLLGSDQVAGTFSDVQIHAERLKYANLYRCGPKTFANPTTQDGGQTVYVSNVTRLKRGGLTWISIVLVRRADGYRVESLTEAALSSGPLRMTFPAAIPIVREPQ